MRVVLSGWSTCRAINDRADSSARIPDCTPHTRRHKLHLSRTVGSEGGRGRWGTPTMAQHIRVQPNGNSKGPSPLAPLMSMGGGVPPPPDRCRAHVAHVRQPRPDSGLGSKCPDVPFSVVPCLLGSGTWNHSTARMLRPQGLALISHKVF
jgi:hypothetical protein